VEPQKQTEKEGRQPHQGGRLNLEGVITAVRYRAGEREYSVTDGNADYAFHSRETLAYGSSVIIDGEANGHVLAVKNLSTLQGGLAQIVYERVAAGVKKTVAAPAAPLLLRDELTTKLWPALKDAALDLMCAKKLGRAVLLRFHGDADGVCGAFAVTSVVNCRAFQQNSAIYSVREALRDLATIGQENRPLIVLLDFGSSDASAEGLGLLKAAGVETLVIDHHPPGKSGIPPNVSPFLVAEGVSRYTAGYLASEIAVACGLPRARGMELARVACSGDKSDILASDESDGKKALVLDFLASHVSFGNNLDFYKNVMAKDELFRSIMQQADESIEDAADKAIIKSKKQQEGALEIVSFPLEALVKKGEWPSSSKITTRVYDKLSSGDGRPMLCLGYTDRSIIIRVNDPAVALGLSANELAEKIKSVMADFVDGGGGHAKAGAIRVKRGFAKDVLNELLRQAAAAAKE
jgi:RecJ-like exonuclease